MMNTSPFFSACHKFNQAMHGKAYPYEVPNDTEQKNIYLFRTTVLVLHSWRAVSAQNPECELPPFREFCRDLAVDIDEKLFLPPETVIEAPSFHIIINI